jgi:K+-sensing histidine kinase KdpD
MEERGTGDRGPVERREETVDRILVALDPSLHSRAALEAAAEMAARFGAELQALFVEDVNVRRLSELPFVQEIGLYSGVCRRVESRELSRQLRVQASRVRRQFQVVTRHIETRCWFEEVRGRVASTVLAAASDVDVIILGKGAWSVVDTGRLTPDVREVLSRAPTSTLVLHAGSAVRPPVRVVYGVAELADKALFIAARLAEDGHLMVFLLADDAEGARRLQQAAEEEVMGRDFDLSFQILTEASISRLTYLMAHEGQGTLVVPADALKMEDEALLDFLNETTAPILLVR